MKKAYEPIKDMTNTIRFYELWRGIADAFMKFIESILIAIGWYHPEEDTDEGED